MNSKQQKWINSKQESLKSDLTLPDIELTNPQYDWESYKGVPITIQHYKSAAKESTCRGAKFYSGNRV